MDPVTEPVVVRVKSDAAAALTVSLKVTMKTLVVTWATSWNSGALDSTTGGVRSTVKVRPADAGDTFPAKSSLVTVAT